MSVQGKRGMKGFGKVFCSRRKGRSDQRLLFTTSPASIEIFEQRCMLSVSSIVFNEFLADPPPGLAGDANGDGQRDGSEDEFIELVNVGTAIDIGGWTLSDAVGVRHTFPTPTDIAAGQAIVIFGGSLPVGLFGNAVVQVASSGFLGLNNAGDTLTLTDEAGGSVSVSYVGGQGVDQSITRSPDLIGEFSDHLTVGIGVFSPGVTATGTTFTDALDVTPPETAAGIAISESDGETRIAEDGAADVIEIALRGMPNDIVTVQLVPDDGQIDFGAGAGEIATLSFTPGNAKVVQTISVHAVDDLQVEGNHSSSFSVSVSSNDPEFDDLAVAEQHVVIEDNDATIASPATGLVINELDVDQAGTDGAEFIELFDGGMGNSVLDGLVLVLFNGNGAAAYQVIDLDGFVTDANGYFVIGDASVTGVDYVPSTFDALGAQDFGSDLQNGEDAAAIYLGDALDFPAGTTARRENLVDAVIYKTGPDAGSSLAGDLGLDAVFDEDENGKADSQALSRSPNGVGPFIAVEPTPGAVNLPLSSDGPSIEVPSSFTITALNSTAPEGNQGTTELTFLVSRSGDLSKTNQVGFTVTSGAVDDGDFENGLPTGELTFGVGDQEQQITVLVASDVDFELDEAFELTLVNATGLAVIDVATASGTIVNDDSLPLRPVDIWLNEFHYDNVGADIDEFVEIAGAAGIDVGGTEIVFYNGSNGEAYAAIELSGTIDDELDGFGAIAFAAPDLQNGGPDGIALLNTDGTVIEFVSYEGIFVATDGLAVGLQSSDVGVFEPGEAGESLQRLLNTKDGDWSGPFAATPGSLNVEPDRIEEPVLEPETEEAETEEAETEEAETEEAETEEAETEEPETEEPETQLSSSIELDKFLWDINGSPELHHHLLVGDELLYAFNVTNTGETELMNVVVSDSLPKFTFEDEVVEAYIGYSQSADPGNSDAVGVFAAVDRELATDPAETKAWDNFRLDAGMYVDGISWSGLYVEPFADGGIAAETDFLIEFFADDQGKPGMLRHEFILAGGQAGVDDAHVRTSIIEGQLSEGGGNVYDYSAMLPFTYLYPGEHWVSITALQNFPNPSPIIDPTWQWQLAGPGDGFYSYDDLFDDQVDGVPFPVLASSSKDLSFTLHATRLADFNGTLPAGQTVTLMGTHLVTQSDLNVGVIHSIANVTANAVVVENPVPVSVAATDEFSWSTKSATLAVTASVIETETAQVASVAVGTPITWNFRVTNTGNVLLSNVGVLDYSGLAPTLEVGSDVLSDGLLSPGETWTFNSVSQIATLGQQQNIGVATASGENGDSARGTDLGFYEGVCASNGADLDNDGQVGFHDFLVFRDAFGNPGGGALRADLDCNGQVEFADFLVLSDQYGKSVDVVFASERDETSI